MKPFTIFRAVIVAGALTMMAATTAFTQSVCGIPANVPVYALTTDNTIFRDNPASRRYSRVARVAGVDGNLIGIDFRAADASSTVVYGTTDTGKIYLIDLSSPQGTPLLVSTVTPRLAEGYQSLMDFNPVVNALRLIGSNDQNIAVVNANGNLNQTIQQAWLQYAAGDSFFGVDPTITAGAYTNNFAGAMQTTFFVIDYDLDTLVTTANTAGGMLNTIGPLVDLSGNPINFAPNTGLDIYTGPDRRNLAVAVSGQTLWCVDLNSFKLPPGPLQKVVATPVQQVPQPLALDPSIVSGGFIDVAVGIAPMVNGADLSVRATGFPSLSNVTYNVAVSNAGLSDAGNVTLSVNQDPTLVLLLAQPSQGVCNSIGRSVLYQLGTVANGANASVRMIYRQGTPVTDTITSSFTVRSDAVDPDPTNNMVSLTIIRPGFPDEPPPLP